MNDTSMTYSVVAQHDYVV